MRVGISLLTLVPGVVGGSETYARELTRALSRVGELDYEAFVPSIAQDAADGLPTRVVAEYRASTTTAGRIAAMSRAWIVPGRVRSALRLETLDAIHFPLTATIPSPGSQPPAAVTVHDLQHELYPQFFSRAELAYRRVLYKHAVTSSRIVVTISEHARDTLLTRYGIDPARVVAIPLGCRPRPPDPGRRAARAVPALPGQSLAAQEPPAALRGTRARAAEAARAQARADGDRPCDDAAGGGREPRARLL